MANTTSSKRVHRWVYLLICLFVTFSLMMSVRRAGRWLVHEDPLGAADVIVVLSGSVPYRAEEAGNLFGMGKAPEVWVSLPESPAAVFQKFGIQFVGEEQYDRDVLLYKGVPES